MIIGPLEIVWNVYLGVCKNSLPQRFSGRPKTGPGSPNAGLKQNEPQQVKLGEHGNPVYFVETARSVEHSFQLSWLQL